MNARNVLISDVGKQSRERKGDDGVPGFIARPGARGIDTQRACSASAKPRAAEGEPGRPEKVRRRWAVIVTLFMRITELTLSLICKLLTNILKKLKISKNESCSTF